MNEFSKDATASSFVPLSVIEDWVGKSDPKLQPAIRMDLEQIKRVFMPWEARSKPEEKKLYLATAGAPATGKTTELDFELRDGGDKRYPRAVFVDPNVYLDYMYTFQREMSPIRKAELGGKALANAYDVARPGSNIIAGVILNQAFDSLMHIAHGVTLTHPASEGSLRKLGEAGYERRLLVVDSPKQTRKAAQQKRLDEGTYHVLPRDFEDKAVQATQRQEVYFRQADHLILLWKPEVNRRAIRAAEYQDGKITIVNDSAYDAYASKYENDRRSLEARGLPSLKSWSQVERGFFDRFSGKLPQLEPRSGAAPGTPLTP